MATIACPACTLENPISQSTCFECYGELFHVFEPGPWICVKCTKLNQPDDPPGPAQLTHCSCSWARRADTSQSSSQSSSQSLNQTIKQPVSQPINQSNAQASSSASFSTETKFSEVEMTDALRQRLCQLFADTARILHKADNDSSSQSVIQSIKQTITRSLASSSKSAGCIIDEVYSTMNIAAQMNDLANQSTQRASSEPHDECQVCYTKFKTIDQSINQSDENKDDIVDRVIILDAAIRLCALIASVNSFNQQLTCAEPNCKQDLHPSLLSGSINQSNNQSNNQNCIDEKISLKFIYEYLHQLLSRSPAFNPCKTSKCYFAFLKQSTNQSNDQSVTCESCNVTQQLDDGELDDEFKQWIEEGKMRGCPSCEQWTFKEYGVCNVIQCVKCGIYWNWQSKETGRNEAELKAWARANRTLWLPGEPTFQVQLEQTNPAEFQAFLERNGQKYDPNYERGG